MTTLTEWIIRPAAALADAATDWDALNAQAGAIPFLESRFLLPLVRHMDAPLDAVALARRAGVLVGAGLLHNAGRGMAETYQPSQLPLGSWIVKPDEDSAALARSLLRALPARKMALGLTQLDPRLARRPEDTDCLQTMDYIQTAWIDVAGSFDAYWEARGKNLRTNMRKQRSKLEADGVRLKFDVLTHSDEIALAIADYGRLEVAGWKATEGTAIHPDNAQGRFYTEMLHGFCGAGRGQIWRLKFDDKVVAMDLCIEGGGTLVILKTAYDPEYRAVSPAFLLKQEAFRRVFQEGRIQRIEFYGKLMEWHTRWTENARTLFHCNLYRWSWVPRARDVVRRLTKGTAAANTDASIPAATS